MDRRALFTFSLSPLERVARGMAVDGYLCPLAERGAGVAASPPVPGRPNPEPDLPGPTPADEGEMPDEDDDGPAVRR